MKVLIIVPAYNEALNLEKTINNIKQNVNYDYIIINDCSTDNTIELCQKNEYNIISLPVNYGLTSAIQLGMKYAYENDYDIVVQFDGDGQHNAEYLKSLVDQIEFENVDISIGSRFVEKNKPFTTRMLGSRLISLCIKILTGKKITDPTSGMRAYNKKTMKMFIDDVSLTPEPDTILYMIKKGLNVKEVQVEMSEREFGESYLNAFKSIKYMLNILISMLFIRVFTKKEKGEK